jgi:class 3 adenylate cyclase/tetratricopeptide (TPR) repeat protein
VICSNCGEANPPRARFCVRCGLSLEGARRRGVRKVVTVVVCDVTGSTALGERLDPELLGLVMARYFDAMRSVLERHHGLLQKLIGDAVVAVFGVPVVREDDALRAVRAAAAMQDAVAELGAALGRDGTLLREARPAGAAVGGGPGAAAPAAEPGVGLEVRIGVATGEVMVGDPMVVGEAVQLATLLQASAGPGEVVLDRQTWRLARDALVVAPVVAGRRAAGPGVPAFRLVDVAPDTPGLVRRQEGPLVGRQAELQLFDWVFRRSVQTSSCHLLTVLGAAGVGKTRLVTAAVDALGEAATALFGHCPSDAEGSTFWPVAEVVRRAAEIKAADSPEQARAKLDELLAGAEDGPQVAERVGRLIGLEASPVPPEDSAWAVRRCLEVVAGRRPLVVVVDDLHWAQPTLLDLLEQVVSLAVDAPMLLVAIARPDLLEQRTGWAGGQRNASTLLLEPLADEESATLVEQLAGDAPLPREAVDHLTRIAEGNPLFLEELLAMLVEEGRLRLDGGRWVADHLDAASVPPTIQALLAARLDRLAGEERAVLDRASVMGQVFDRAALLALSPPAARADLPDQLLSLVRKELLRPSEGPFGDRDGLQFRHLLVRDAAYESLPKQTRAELHERYAGWLAETAGARGRELEEVIGWHLERAHRHLAELGPLDDHGRELAAKAAARLAAAGRRAIGRGDLPAAVNLLDRAVALLPAEDRDRPHLLTELGEALLLKLEPDRAAAVLDEALAAADRSGDAVLRAHATLGGLDLRLDTEPDRPDEGPGGFRAEVHQVLSVLEDLDDHQGQARAWRLLGLDSYLRCRVGTAEEEFQRAIAHAEAAGDERLEAGVAYALAQAAFWGPAPVAEGIARCEDIRRRAEGSYRVEMAALHTLAALHAMQGRFGQARELANASAAIAHQLGPNRFAAICSQFLGQTELLAGDPAAAERRLRWGYGILERMGERGLRSELAANLARAVCAQGRDDEALRLARLSGELAFRDDLYAQVERRGPLATVLARRGRQQEAERVAAEAVAMASRSDMLTMQANALVDHAEVLRLGGRRDLAAPLLAEAVARYDRKGNLVARDRAAGLLADPPDA